MTTTNDQQCPECNAGFPGVGPLGAPCKACNGTGRKPVASEAVERIAALVSRKLMKAATDGCVVFSWQEMRRLDDHVAECAAKDARIAEIDFALSAEKHACRSLELGNHLLRSQLAAAHEALRACRTYIASDPGGPLLAILETIDAVLAAPPADGKPLTAHDVQWIVNDIAELGVRIGNQFFFLYKGGSLVYEDAKHDDGSPMWWRPVFKREFGECCHPVNYEDLRKCGHQHLIGTVSLADSEEWKALPPADGKEKA